MKAKLKAVVIRKLDGTVVAIEGINNIYNEVDISIPFSEFTSEELETMKKSTNNFYPAIKIGKNRIEIGYEAEAIDICSKNVLDCLNISIDDYFIEIN